MSDPISRWWVAFQSQAPHLAAHFCGEEECDIPSWMDDYLGAIHPDLMWEFGRAIDGPGHRLVITPECERQLRPLVQEILRRAPPIDRWEFYGYRLAEDLEHAALSVEARTGGNLEGVRVRAQRGNFNRIDLAYQFAGEHFDQNEALNIAFVATESLLGEEVLNRWIGAIEVEQSDGQAEAAELDSLQATVAALIDGVRRDLPDRPWHQADLETDWTLLECDREEADDYSNQDDLFVGVTIVPELWQNALSGVPFDSIRYSRFGECFCYLKIDGTAGQEHCEFADRGEIEEAVNAVLRPSQLGSVVGGGTGRRYSYVELALIDVDAAWQQIGVVLSNGRLPKRTWLLFHDADLAAQWFGLYDDTPEPPLQAEGWRL